MNLNTPKKFFVTSLILVFGLVMLSGCGVPEPEDSELGTEMEEPQTEGNTNQQESGSIEKHNDIGNQVNEDSF